MRLLRILLRAVVTTLLLMVCCQPLLAQAFTYQGMLKEKGVPADGIYDFLFQLYEVPSGIARPIGTITVDDLRVANGLFTVSLDFGAVWNGRDRYLEIGVRRGNSTGSYTILYPRVKVNFAPYSVLSLDALSAQSVPWSGITGVPSSFPPGGSAGGDLSGSYPNPVVVGVQGRPVASAAPSAGQVLKWSGTLWSPAEDLRDAFWESLGNDIFYNRGMVGVGVPYPTYPFHVEGSASAVAVVINRGTALASTGVMGQADAPSGRGVMGMATHTTGDNTGVYGQTNSDHGKAVRGWASATTGWTYGGLFGASSPLGCGVQGESPALGVRGIASATGGEAYGVYGRTTSADGYGVYGIVSATSGRNYGVFGQSDSTDGAGVAGRATATTGMTCGVYGRSDSTSGRGVYGLASATSGTTYGRRFVSESSSGTGVYGEASASSGATYGGRFFSLSNSGTGAYGEASSSSGTTYGVYGRSNSTEGRGVYGRASATTGYCYGGWFESASTEGRGVLGWASATSGSTIGVAGESASSAYGVGVFGWAYAESGITYGVYGQSDCPNGYGVYSRGRFAATGTKSFQIDHPLNPENAVLNHYSAEGPEPYNIYRGTVVLDARGEAWVQLPDYFEAINRDPTITLTPVGAPMPNLHVAVEVQDNRFKIAGGVPGKKVFWRVEAVRNDRWVQEYGYQTEQPKPIEQRGKYLHPELYGQPKELGIRYRPEPAREVTPPAPEKQ